MPRKSSRKPSTIATLTEPQVALLEPSPSSNGEPDPIQRLSRLQVHEAASFSREQALALVGTYYGIQKLRVGSSNKISAHNRQVDILSDSALIVTLKEELHKLEKQAVRGLKEFAEAKQLGRWALSHLGVGPVICAGLLAHIDLERCCCPEYRHLKGRDRDKIPPHKCPGLVTAGAIWKFAGIHIARREIRWEKGERRPFNLQLKTLLFKLGESFKKVSNHPEAFYGHLYKQRKAQEVGKNERGLLAQEAKELLQDARFHKRNLPAELREIWESGKLPAGGLDLRAMRWTVRIFLSHWHQVGREILGLPVVAPYVQAQLGHVHIMQPANWPMKK